MAVGSIPELLLARAADRPDQLYLHCGQAVRTYAETAEAAQRLAGGLARIGIAPGDRVATLVPNRVEMAELFFGLARLGAVQVPMNTFLKGEFLRYQVHDCAAGTIVVDGPGLAAIVPLLGELPELERIVVLPGGDEGHLRRLIDDEGALRRVQVTRYETLLEPSDTPLPDLPGPADLCTVMYTSGTTGMPKGCMLGHAYVLHVGETWAGPVCEFAAGDVVFTPLPLFHTSGQAMGLVAALHAGVSVAVEPTFSASGFWPRVVELGATVVLGVGAMAHALLAQPPGDLDRSHRVRLWQWTPLAPREQRAFEERFGGMVRGQGYGQTECVPITYSSPSGAQRPQTSGRAAPWLEVAIVDDADEPVACGTAGEVVIRPRRPHVMFDGYWGKPAETLETFRNLWHHTGDLARMDADGHLTFVDRKKDAVRRRGENVSSMQVEAAILRHPKVTEVAVHAVAAASEDDIKACIVAAPGEPPTPAELFTHFADELPYFAIPRYVELVDALPRNAMGRVQKHLLRDRGNGTNSWDLESLGLTVSTEERRERSAIS